MLELLLLLLLGTNVWWWLRYRKLVKYARHQAYLRHPSAGRSRVVGD